MKFIKGILVCLCVLLIVNKTHGQIFYENNLDLLKIKNIKNSLIDSLIDVSVKEKDTISTIKIAHYFSVQKYKKRHITQALKYALIEVRFFENYNIINDNYYNAVYNTGRFYYLNFEYDKAKIQFKKVINESSNTRKIAQSYGEMGKIYDEEEEYFRAISFYEKGIFLLEKKQNKSLKELRSLFSIYINTAVSYNKIETRNSLKNSLLYLKKAQYLLNKKNKLRTTRNLVDLNANIANHYNNSLTMDVDKAKITYFKNLILAKKDSFVISNTYLNLGELYLNNNRDSCLYFLKNAIKYSKNIPLHLMNSYRNEAKYFLNKKKLNKALNSINNSILTQLKELDYKTVTELTLLKLNNKSFFLEALKVKAKILLKIYKKDKNVEILLKTMDVIKLGDKLINIIQEESFESQTKFYWQKEASVIYSLGNYVSILMKNYDMVFYFMEKNKALILTKDIIKNTNLNSLPKNIIDKKNVLKRELLSLENELKKTNDNQKAKFNDTLFRKKQNYYSFIDSIKKIYPSVFKKRLKVENISLREIQNKLNKDEVVVSYMWGEYKESIQSLFGLLITKKEIMLYEKNIKEVNRLLKEYKRYISKPLKTASELKQFKKTSFELYRQLFPSKRLREKIKDKKLLIIPDGDLQNIPFEALITKEKGNEYLIKTNNISYGYSMSFLEYNKQIKRKTSTNFVGYAPINFNNDKLLSLNNTEQELNEIGNYISGDFFFNENASKTHFLDKSGNSKIIHLATHANATNNPWIAFSDDKLELHELYTYKNNAEIVTLSACETSLGEVVKGEGVLSLARGFFYSGAKSVVSSLWSVNDKSTSFIMKDFYKNLKEGESKSLALTNAKRSYLKNHSLSEQSPYYWASFILIGDDDSISFNDSNYFKIIFLSVLFLMFFFFIYKKNKKEG